MTMQEMKDQIMKAVEEHLEARITKAALQMVVDGTVEAAWDAGYSLGLAIADDEADDDDEYFDEEDDDFYDDEEEDGR